MRILPGCFGAAGFVVLGLCSALLHAQQASPGAAETRIEPPVITAIAVQNGGSLTATAGDDHFVRVWNSATGELVHRLASHTGWVRTVAFSPDGDLLASGGNDRRLLLWRPSTGQLLQEIAAHRGAVTAIAFDPRGGKLAAAGFEDKLRVYDTTTARVVHEVVCPCKDIRALEYSPDGKTIAIGGRDGKIHLFDSSTGKVVRSIKAHTRRVRALSFSPDGTNIVSTGEDRAVRVTPAAAGTPKTLPRQSTKIMSLAYLPGNRVALGGSDNVVHVWDIAAGRQTQKFEGHTGSVTALKHKGGVLYSGGYDTTLRTWRVDP